MAATYSATKNTTTATTNDNNNNNETTFKFFWNDLAVKYVFLDAEGLGLGVWFTIGHSLL